MGVNKYNAEGYYDPTAYEALTRIERESKKMPLPATSRKNSAWICLTNAATALIS